MSLQHRVSKKATARILTIDIERLPGLARVWEPRTKYVPPRQFVKWPELICFAARWYGTKEPIFASAWEDGRAAMIAKAHALYQEADVVVTFNGIRFDNKHLRSDWLLEGLAPPKPWKDVDLYRVATQFGFESRSLDSLTRRLGRGGKAMHYSMELAEAAAAGDSKAQAALRRYNVGDVELTEWLYDRLRGYIPGHPHPVVSEKPACNQCGSEDLKRDGTYRAVVIDYSLYQCRKCGGWVRGTWHSKAALARGVR